MWRAPLMLMTYRASIKPLQYRIFKIQKLFNTSKKSFISNNLTRSYCSSVGKISPQMAISFTCKVCQNRTTKTFSKLSYEKGVVIIKCPGCNNNHLIADNLGWFRDKKTNIEDIMKDKGEEINKLNSEGLIDLDNK